MNVTAKGVSTAQTSRNRGKAVSVRDHDGSRRQDSASCILDASQLPLRYHVEANIQVIQSILRTMITGTSHVIDHVLMLLNRRVEVKCDCWAKRLRVEDEPHLCVTLIDDVHLQHANRIVLACHHVVVSHRRYNFGSASVRRQVSRRSIAISLWDAV